MEDIHGVSVSWVHHPSKPGSHETRQRSTSASSVARDGKQPPHTTNEIALRQTRPDGSFPGAVTPAAISQPAGSTANATPSAPSPARNGAPPPKTQSRRPGLLSRGSSDKMNGGQPKRTSWISNISNKFSSSTTSVDKTPPATPQANGPQSNSPMPYGPGHSQSSASKTSLISEPAEETELQSPGKSKEPGFFSHLTRKWSAGSQASGGIPKVNGKGGICERRVLNVDPNRERCLVPEMDPSRLRKVSFCVDVEIAGGPRYHGDDGDEEDRKKNFVDAKAKERAEGDALRRPDAIAEEADTGDVAKLEEKRKEEVLSDRVEANAVKPEQNDTVDAGNDNSESNASADKKKEKKKRSEEERKERKEKRRRRAEENGSIPVELSLDIDPDDAPDVFSRSHRLMASRRFA